MTCRRAPTWLRRLAHAGARGDGRGTGWPTSATTTRPSWSRCSPPRCSARSSCPLNTRLAPPEILHRARVRPDQRRGARAGRPQGAAEAGPARVRVVVGEPARTTPSRCPPRPRSGTEAGLRPRPHRAHRPARRDARGPRADHLHLGHDRAAEGRRPHPRNLTWNALNVLVDYDLVSTDVALMISPLFHVASLGMGACPCCSRAARSCSRRGSIPGAPCASSSGTGRPASAASPRPIS